MLALQRHHSSSVIVAHDGRYSQHGSASRADTDNIARPGFFFRSNVPPHGVARVNCDPSAQYACAEGSVNDDVNDNENDNPIAVVVVDYTSDATGDGASRRGPFPASSRGVSHDG